MIFGEYLGEVVSNGEYEVRAQGTTLAQLNAAIAELSDEEFFDSFLTVSIDSYIEDFIWSPYSGKTGETRSYAYIYPHTAISASSVGVNEVGYWYNNNIVKTVKTQNVSTKAIERTNTSVSAGTLTLNSWTLYTRKQTLAIQGGGSTERYDHSITYTGTDGTSRTVDVTILKSGDTKQIVYNLPFFPKVQTKILGFADIPERFRPIYSITSYDSCINNASQLRYVENDSVHNEFIVGATSDNNGGAYGIFTYI